MLTGLPKFMEKRQLGVAATLARRQGRGSACSGPQPELQEEDGGDWRCHSLLSSRGGPGAPRVHEGEVVRTKEEPVPLTPELEDLYGRGTEELSDTDKENSGPFSGSTVTSFPLKANLLVGQV